MSLLSPMRSGAGDDGNSGAESQAAAEASGGAAAAQQLLVDAAPEGHILLTLPPGEVVSGPMAEAAAEEIKQLAGARKLPMLLVLTGVEAITRGARSVFNSAESMLAVAVLGASPVDRVIANFLLGGAVQPCPTRYFSTEQEALAWLKHKKNDV